MAVRARARAEGPPSHTPLLPAMSCRGQRQGCEGARWQGNERVANGKGLFGRGLMVSCVTRPRIYAGAGRCRFSHSQSPVSVHLKLGEGEKGMDKPRRRHGV